MKTPIHVHPESTTPKNRIVGVDVHKDVLFFDAGDDDHGQIPNTAADIAKLITRLQRKTTLGTTLHVCCEASGPVDRTLLETCRKRAIPASRLNPLRVKKHRESLGVLAKTDAEDARAIRHFAEALRPAPLPKPDPTREALRERHLTRDALIAARTALSNLRLSLTRAPLGRQLEAVTRLLDNRADRLEAEIKRTAEAADEDFRGLVAALDAIKGVALLGATKMAAHCPELGTMSRRRAASLAGVAPFPDDSAERHGERVTKGGRKHLRVALYMAAQSAARFNDVLRPVYEHLRAEGKAPKVALTALMRKLMLHANSVAREHRAASATPGPARPAG